MMRLAAATSGARTPRVAICPLGGAAPAEIADILQRRKIATQIATLADAGAADVGAIAAVAASRLTERQAAELAPLCRAAAIEGRPVILLAPPSRFRDPTAAAVLSAYLESAKALVFADPDSWLEAVVLIAAFAIPRGPQLAVVSPAGGWLEAAAESLALEHQSQRVRAQSATDVGSLAPTDIALCDYREMPAQTALDGLLIVPLCPRAEVVGDFSRPVLVGLRPALAAAAAAGRLRRRLDDRDEPPAGFDWDRIDRQLDKIDDRAGDHETKVLLAAAGVAITRQAVATTASSATRLAKRAGFPAQMKPWGPEVPDERSGCPVERDLETAADVRRAFARLAGESGAAIVRETPPRGRELSLVIERRKHLGAVAVVTISGEDRPLAATSPISELDAERIADTVVATRAGEAEPDRASLADLLRRVSALHAERDLATLAVPRIVAGPREALAVDAWSKR
jgi:hypothetical protein